MAQGIFLYVCDFKGASVKTQLVVPSVSFDARWVPDVYLIFVYVVGGVTILEIECESAAKEANAASTTRYSHISRRIPKDIIRRRIKRKGRPKSIWKSLTCTDAADALDEKWEWKSRIRPCWHSYS